MTAFPPQSPRPAPSVPEKRTAKDWWFWWVIAAVAALMLVNCKPPVSSTILEKNSIVDTNSIVRKSSFDHYKNCTAARAAGADPIYAGEPGYNNRLDRDGDGVACE